MHVMIDAAPRTEKGTEQGGTLTLFFIVKIFGSIFQTWDRGIPHTSTTLSDKQASNKTKNKKNVLRIQGEGFHPTNTQTPPRNVFWLQRGI